MREEAYSLRLWSRLLIILSTIFVVAFFSDHILVAVATLTTGIVYIVRFNINQNRFYAILGTILLVLCLFSILLATHVVEYEFFRFWNY